MKRLLIAVVLVVLAGCGAGGPAKRGNDVVLPDGRTVTCVVYKQGYAGGISCDWEGAR